MFKHWARLGATFLGALLATALTTRANTVSVAEVGTSPSMIVKISSPTLTVSPYNTPDGGWVYAGIAKLTIDGKPTDGFCIDPYHFSSSSALPYTYVNLQDAPKPPGPMGAAAADKISKLWAIAYSPTMSALDAAAMQVAIWQIVSTGTGAAFNYLGGQNATDTANLATRINQFYTAINNFTGTAAKLVGLTGSGQDYVVQAVPELGATAALLGGAFVVLLLARKKLDPAQSAERP